MEYKGDQRVLRHFLFRSASDTRNNSAREKTFKQKYKLDDYIRNINYQKVCIISDDTISNNNKSYPMSKEHISRHLQRNLNRSFVSEMCYQFWWSFVL